MYKENDQLTAGERKMYSYNGYIHGETGDFCRARCPSPQPSWSCTQMKGSHRIHAAVSVDGFIFAIWGEDEDPDLALEEGL